MRAVKEFFSSVARLFTHNYPRIKMVLNVALRYVPEALQVIELVSMATPTQIDDALVIIIKKSYPVFFDVERWKAMTDGERKALLLGIAGEVLKAKFPGITTTIARTAVQTAYAVKFADDQLGKLADWIKP